ncbi:uncharacterized protein LOC124138323 isoform X2 [Haliotis rufescens]|uniref:uncharacterized protein LOC124138323 isoform X2 n=1 Tax=Haliotis rufescens TaxID=6454 RepID=UPI00201EEF32|nr:uncharacterized protein LOC124138323 isoform X2 [Haliotis rufescens]
MRTPVSYRYSLGGSYSRCNKPRYANVRPSLQPKGHKLPGNKWVEISSENLVFLQRENTFLWTHFNMAEKMTLYYHPLYRSVRNIWLIKEMGVEEDFKLIHYKPNMDEAASIAYRRDVHPHGTIPALVIPGEGTMLESGAINMYLADRYGKLVPDPKDRKDYYDFIMYANSTLDELLEFFCDMWLLKVAETEERQARMRDKLNTCLDHLSNRLEGRDFLCGDKITAADCVLGYDIYVCSLLKDGELFQNHPKIREYLDRLKSRSALQETTKDDQSYLQSLYK